MLKSQSTTVSDLTTHIANFKKWLEAGSGDSAKWEDNRKARLAWYREHLTKDRLTNLSREDLATLVKQLWAVNIWHNKDHKVGKVVDDNGIDKIRVALNDLFYGTTPLENRWDKFRATIKGLGSSSLSEILTFFDPQKYALVNLKPYEVLPRLGCAIDPVKDGKSYKKAIDELGKLKVLLKANGLADADFIVTDFFVAYLFYEVFDLEGRRSDKAIVAPPTKPEVEAIPGKSPAGSLLIATHESAESVLLMLGNLLGYDTYTPDASRTYDGKKLGEIATLEDLPAFMGEKVMDSVRNIDVVWLRDEWPEYLFEVEHTTGVTSGLLRIYQAQKLNTKFFIIGPKDVLKKFEKEIEKAPFNAIKHKYQFRSYEELREMCLAASNYRIISDKFLAG
jgi:hypothetical protein